MIARRTVQVHRAPVHGAVRVPGSKSYSARALIAAALARGRSRLVGLSNCDDTRVLIDALARLGVEFETTNGDCVVDSSNGLTSLEGTIDIGRAGTTLRFLLPLIATTPGSDVVLTGDARMCERPIGDLVEALAKLGCSIDSIGTAGRPPLRVRGARIDGGRVSLSGAISSQFTSALLLVGPTLEHGLDVEVLGTLGSRSYVDMTREVMRDFGVDVVSEGRVLRAPRRRYRARTYRIDGDATGAAYFWALAALTGGRVKLENLRLDSPQGDLRFLSILVGMGCRLRQGTDDGGDWIEVSGADTLRGVEVDMETLPDSAQTLAVVAAVAQGDTTIRGLQSLPLKETDRLAALKCELAKIGIEAKTTAASITILGGEPHGAAISTYGDHRMAMAFAILGARVEGISIEDPDVVSKSFPDFWSRLEELGIETDAG